jgi:hypothetical protein
VNFSHILKFEILGCDKIAPLKRNLVPEIWTDWKRNLGNSIKSLEAMIKSSIRVDGECTCHHSWGILSRVGIQCSTQGGIQKEILSIFALKLKKHIREEIGDAKFSIIADEICDVSKSKQMAIVLRFVDNSHLGSISSLMNLSNPLCAVLQNLDTDCTAGTHRADGDTTFNYMITFDTARR